MKSLRYLVLLVIFLNLPTVLMGQDAQLERLIRGARQDLNSGKLKTALSQGLEGLAIAESVGDVPKTNELNFLLGSIYHRDRNYAKAIEHYINIIHPQEQQNLVTPELAEAYFELGNVNSSMGAYNQANKQFGLAYMKFESLNDHTGKAKARLATGDNHLKFRKYAQAIGAYRLLIQNLNNSSGQGLVTGAYEGMMVAIRHQGDVAYGIQIGEEYLRRVSEPERQSAVVADALGGFKRANEEYQEAINLGRLAVRSSPGNIRYKQNLARSLIEVGNEPEAMALLRDAKNKAQSSGDPFEKARASNELAFAMIEFNDSREAIEELEFAEKIGKEHHANEELKATYELFIRAYELRNYSSQVRKYQFLLKDVLPRIANDEELMNQNISTADKLAVSFERQSRLEQAEAFKQRQLVLEENKKVEELTREQSDKERELLNQREEAARIQEDLQETKKKLSAQQREIEITGRVREQQIESLRELEAQQELELARREKLILERESELQAAQIESAGQRQRLLLIIIGLGSLALVTLVFFIIRGNRARRIIAKQNKDLELQQYELQQTQIELTKTLENEQRIRKTLQQSNKELKETQSQLIHAEKMSSLGQLTAGIVHEINNPVNFVKGGVETLDRTMKEIIKLLTTVHTTDFRKIDSESLYALKRKLEEELEYAEESAPMIMKDLLYGISRIEEIVKGLRIFSRQDEAKAQSSDLHKLIDSSLLILSTKKNEGIKIEKYYDDDIDEIECFPGPLSQVFVNLIGNAIDAINADGTITIITVNHEDMVHVHIKDNGKGMEKDVMEHIFEPFFTTKEVGKGTGLGLSITYSIIEKHNGIIEVDSAPNVGTEFVIKLQKHLALLEV